MTSLKAILSQLQRGFTNIHESFRLHRSLLKLPNRRLPYSATCHPTTFFSGKAELLVSLH
jgi:hypothetical protein